MSPGSASYFFHYNGEVKQLHTHKGFQQVSLPSVKSVPPSPPLLHQENATEKYQFNNYNGSIY
jgi:hypothetical protein